MKISEIIGHNDKIEHFKKAVEHGRLAHAYIFHGPAGIGKKTTALALIKYIFCEDFSFKGESGDSCQKCASCRKLEAYNHPDLLMVTPEKSSIKIDMIRDLQSRLNLGRFNAKFKFVIIDDAECLRIEAANALLKTLEEPAKDVVIILVTSKINMLLPTIISRCQKIRFNPISISQIKKRLIDKYGLESGEADIISAFLQGSFAKMNTEDFDEIITLRRELVKSINKMSLDNFSEIISFSNRLAKEEKDFLVEIIEMIKSFYRDALMIKCGIFDNFINKDIKENVNKIANRMTKDEIFDSIESMNKAQELLMANVNKKLLIETAMTGLCA